MPGLPRMRWIPKATGSRFVATIASVLNCDAQELKRITISRHALGCLMPSRTMRTFVRIENILLDINIDSHGLLDPQQATDNCLLVDGLTEVYGIHIVVVLHQNKGDANARGHVGAELTNKAETVLSVTKDTQNRNISIVEAEYCRDRDFTPFAFYVDSNALPALAEDHELEKDQPRKTKTPYDYEPAFHSNVVRRIFQKESKFKHSELVRQTQTILQSIIGSIGDSKTKSFIQYFLHMGFIIKEGADRSRNTFYSVGQLG
jgi:hypothetical protein